MVLRVVFGYWLPLTLRVGTERTSDFVRGNVWERSRIYYRLAMDCDWTSGGFDPILKFGQRAPMRYVQCEFIEKSVELLPF
jgi:hypothetical protein